MGTLYLIQDMTTGMRMTAGGSKAQLSHDKPPRLFRLANHAERALACWRLGLWYNDIDQYGDGDGPKPLFNKFNIERAEKRQAMDLRVRPVRLEVGG